MTVHRKLLLLQVILLAWFERVVADIGCSMKPVVGLHYFPRVFRLRIRDHYKIVQGTKKC